MTKERAKEVVKAWEAPFDIMRAFIDGKDVQRRLRRGMAGPPEPKWEDDPDPNFAPGYEWRVKPEPREWWMNVYESEAKLHPTEQHANSHAGPNRIECVQVQEMLNSNVEPAPKEKYHADARVALWWLNEKSGRHFRETDANLAIISQRLREPDVDIEGVKTMIDRQCRRWRGTAQEEYLRPETLFGKTKFDGYFAARELPIEDRDPLVTECRVSPEPGEWWINVYPKPIEDVAHPTRESADNSASSKRVKCVRAREVVE